MFLNHQEVPLDCIEGGNKIAVLDTNDGFLKVSTCESTF